MKIPPRAVLLCLFAAAGCAGGKETYPSLSPRAVEKSTDEPENTATKPFVAADAPTLKQIDSLLSDARSGETAFTAALPATERAVSAARGAAPSSESWVAAQQQLSVLDAARAPTAASMTALDSLYIALADKVTADAATGGLLEAQAARDAVQTLYDAQIARLSTLQAALSQP